MKLKLMSNMLLNKVKSHSPELCLAAGLGLMITGGIVAAVKTRKLDDVIEEHSLALDDIDASYIVTNAEHCGEEKLPVKGDANYKEYRHDIIMTYKDTGVALVKMYGVPVVLTVGGVSLVCAAYGIMKKRNALLLGAYSALEAYNKQILERVDEVCSDDDKAYIRDGIRKEKLEVTEVDEKGKTKKHKEDVLTVANGIDSPYTLFYGGGYGNSSGDPDDDKFVLISLQNQFNDRLRSHGVVFLNEVRDALGYEPTQIGAVTGWVYNGDGDNFISFGIGDMFDDRGHMPVTTFSDAAVRFINGYEQVVLLNFNVDGVIIDKI